MSLRILSITTLVVLVTPWISTVSAKVEDIGVNPNDNVVASPDSLGKGVTYDEFGSTQTDYDFKADNWSSPSVTHQIPASVVDFAPVSAFILDYLSNTTDSNGSMNNFLDNPFGDLGALIYLSTFSTLPTQALPLAARAQTNAQAGCSGDGTTIDVLRCEASEDGLLLPSPSPDANNNGQYSEQDNSLWSAVGLQPSDGATLPLWGTEFTIQFSCVDSSFACGSPTFFANPTLIDADLTPINANQTPDVFGIKPDVFGANPLVDLREFGLGPSSVPETPLPAMLLIGFGGIALTRWKKLLRTIGDTASGATFVSTLI